MGFVNEFISEEDQKRCDLSRIKRPRLYLDSIRPDTWTANDLRSNRKRQSAATLYASPARIDE